MIECVVVKTREEVEALIGARVAFGPDRHEAVITGVYDWRGMSQPVHGTWWTMAIEIHPATGDDYVCFSTRRDADIGSCGVREILEYPNTVQSCLQRYVGLAKGEQCTAR